MVAHNVQLSEQDWDFIRQAVASGAYHDESEVLRAGLRLLEAEQRPLPWDEQSLFQLAQPGIEQLDRGEYDDVPLGDVAAYLDAIGEEEHPEEAA